MKQLIKEHTYYADEIICPYCKHKFTEDYSYEAYGNEYRTDFDYECDECGEVFNVNVDFSVHFISTPYAYTLEEVLGKGRIK